MKPPPVEAMVVVIPVRNEADLLGRSLEALSIAVEAARDAHLRCEVRIVLDACTDGSADIAAGFGFPVVACAAARVGAARRLGVAAGLATLGDVAASRVWIANTDADSRVPPHWLVHQRAVSRAADVYLGTVRPDFEGLPLARQALWLQTHPPGRANSNVHGANLGVRATTYESAGGFAAIREQEDVDLVARCRARGAVVIGEDAAEVVTSARLVGRTPGGYAGFLRRQASELVPASPDRGRPSDAAG